MSKPNSEERRTGAQYRPDDSQITISDRRKIRGGKIAIAGRVDTTTNLAAYAQDS
jgi:hypothetical protein